MYKNFFNDISSCQSISSLKFTKYLSLFFSIRKTKGKKGNKNDKRHQNESGSESDQKYKDDDFDSKNPFANDEVESFHEESKIESFRKRLDEEFTIKGSAIVIP